MRVGNILMLLAVYAMLSVVVLLLLLQSGCAPKPGGPSWAAATSIARADAKVQVSIPHSDAFGKELLTSARTDLKEADLASQRQAEETRMVEASFTRFRSYWYVKLGVFIGNAVKWLLISYAALGVVVVVLGVLNPFKGAVGLGSEIVRAIPIMNPFAWLRDWLQARKAAA